MSIIPLSRNPRMVTQCLFVNTASFEVL
ncbi:hypothetical protein IM043_gp211 [Bacillus phage SPG24]|nr:hypothetical protein IM043_gp211 [Bacillus phage SPG24]